MSSSYQVFARKYRPQTFDAVIGQEHITQTLRNAIAADRLAHAYLFVGPRGTGKTSTARILAKALNCIHGPTINPCGECDVCREIAAGNSLDVLEIDGASNNGVEQVRELRENVRFAPTRGKYKVYIIDEVHMLTSAAFNALLKTLEEPPEHVKFIFATTDVQKVLPTILSRCQRFDLRRIPAELIAGHLGYIAQNEGISLAPEAARTVARGAEGGLRDAESMLDQLVAFCGERIEEEDVLSVFGFTAAETVASLCDALLDGDAPAALGIVQEQAQAGRDLSRLMADLIGHLRNLLVAKADPEGIKAEVGEAELAVLEEQAGQINLDRLLELIEQFAAAEGRMKWAPNKKLHFEIAVIKAIQTLEQASLTEVIAALTALKEGKEIPVRPERPKRERAPRPVRPKVAAREAVPLPPPASVVKAVEPKPVVVEEPAVVAAVPSVVIEERPVVEEVLVEPEPNPADDTEVAPPSAAAPVVNAEREDSLFGAPEPSLTDETEVAPPSAATPVVAAEREDSLFGASEPNPVDDTEVAPPGASAPVVAAERELLEGGPLCPPPALEPEFAREPEFESLREPTAPEDDTPPWEERATPPELPQEAPTPSAAPASTDLWPRLVAAVHERKQMIGSRMMPGTLLSLEKGQALVGFPEADSFTVEYLSKPANREVVEAAFGAITGGAVAVRFETRAGLQPGEVTLPEPEPEADPMEAFQNDPLIRKALELFQAEIQIQP